MGQVMVMLKLGDTAPVYRYSYLSHIQNLAQTTIILILPFKCSTDIPFQCRPLNVFKDITIETYDHKTPFQLILTLLSFRPQNTLLFIDIFPLNH